MTVTEIETRSLPLPVLTSLRLYNLALTLSQREREIAALEKTRT